MVAEGRFAANAAWDNRSGDIPPALTSRGLDDQDGLARPRITRARTGGCEPTLAALVGGLDLHERQADLGQGIIQGGLVLTQATL